VLTVGLTGGIGSGKSTVAAALRQLGAVVIDADVVAREVVEPGTPTLAAIVDRFGSQLLRVDGSLDRPGLARLVFPDPAALADLNTITTPAIRARLSELRAAAPREAVTVLDIALLIERRLWPHEHLAVVVDAPVEIRVRRLVRERGLEEKDVRHRIAAQASDTDRRAAADIWIDNRGSRTATRRQVDDLWRTRLGPYNKNLLTRTRGHRPEKAVLADPDSTWPDQAARLMARIADALGNQSVRVDHIGSTSVPDLLARDVLDLQVGVPSLADADEAAFVENLTRRGFLRLQRITQDHAHPPAENPGDWRKRFHVSMDPGRLANVHIRQIDSPGWLFALQFRDWLRADGATRDAYAEHKKHVLEVTDSGNAYAAGKEPWFDQAYPKVVAWARRTGWKPPYDHRD
jgi:dephospho-CoA kinase